MGKVSTDPGLGKLGAGPAPGKANTDPGLGGGGGVKPPSTPPKERETDPGPVESIKIKAKPDTVDELLEGFKERPDRPRILPPSGEITPTPPPPVVEAKKKDLTPTEPGKRQRQRNVVLSVLLGFLLVVGIAALIFKLAGGKDVQPPPAQTALAPPPVTAPAPVPTPLDTVVTTADTATASAAPVVKPKPVPTVKATTAVTTAKPTTTDTTNSHPPDLRGSN